MMWSNVEFHNPEFLWMLLIIPILGIWYFFVRTKDTATLKMADTKGFSVKEKTMNIKELETVSDSLAKFLLDHSFP